MLRRPPPVPHVNAASARPDSEINRRQRRVLRFRDDVLDVLDDAIEHLGQRSRDELLQELLEDITLRRDDPDGYYGKARRP